MKNIFPGILQQHHFICVEFSFRQFEDRENEGFQTGVLSIKCIEYWLYIIPKSDFAIYETSSIAYIS